MARVSYVQRDSLPADLQAFWNKALSYGPVEHQLGAMAHRPAILTHMFGMLGELRAEGVVSRRHLELALVAVSQLNHCDYCVAHHAPALTVEGMTEAGVARLLDFADHPELDEADRLVVEYSRLVTETPGRVRDTVFTRLRQHFSEAQIVELTWRIALCGAFNRFNEVLQLEVEDEALADVA